MPHHIKIRKIAFYRMLRRNIRGESKIRVLDQTAFDWKILPRVWTHMV